MGRAAANKAGGMGCLLAAMLALGGCWDDRERRPAMTKGVYPGEPQKQLSDDVVKKLQQRTTIQRGGNI